MEVQSRHFLPYLAENMQFVGQINSHHRINESYNKQDDLLEIFLPFVTFRRSNHTSAFLLLRQLFASLKFSTSKQSMKTLLNVYVNCIPEHHLAAIAAPTWFRETSFDRFKPNHLAPFAKPDT